MKPFIVTNIIFKITNNYCLSNSKSSLETSDCQESINPLGPRYNPSDEEETES